MISGFQPVVPEECCWTVPRECFWTHFPLSLSGNLLLGYRSWLLNPKPSYYYSKFECCCINSTLAGRTTPLLASVRYTMCDSDTRQMRINTTGTLEFLCSTCICIVLPEIKPGFLNISQFCHSRVDMQLLHGRYSLFR